MLDGDDSRRLWRGGEASVRLGRDESAFRIEDLVKIWFSLFSDLRRELHDVGACTGLTTSLARIYLLAWR